MTNRKELREQLLLDAGWVQLLWCKACAELVPASNCNNLECPWCSGNLTDARSRWRPKKFKLEGVKP